MVGFLMRYSNRGRDGDGDGIVGEENKDGDERGGDD